MGWGFKGSAFVALVDIYAVKQITERKAQLARFAYFTVPLTTMAAGWMGGIELGKLPLAGIARRPGLLEPSSRAVLWESGPETSIGGLRTGLVLGALGWIYQYSTNNNLTNTITNHNDNPNIPTGRFNYNQAFFWPTKGENGTDIHEKMGWYPKDPGPSWKKWEDKAE